MSVEHPNLHLVCHAFMGPARGARKGGPVLGDSGEDFLASAAGRSGPVRTCINTSEVWNILDYHFCIG